MRRRLLLAAVIAMTPLASLAASKSDPSQAAPSVTRDGGLQTELPIEAAPETSWFTLPPWLADTLLWGAVIAGAVTIAIAMRNSLPGLDRSRGLTASNESDASRSKPNSMSAARSEADELAARGRYAEAMHVLLLRALAELRERLELSFADLLTSREILRRAPLESAARQAFARIIGDVELTHFGDALADREGYSACREQFESLRRALGATAAR